MAWTGPAGVGIDDVTSGRLHLRQRKILSCCILTFDESGVIAWRLVRQPAGEPERNGR